jgi:hypothetical protein
VTIDDREARTARLAAAAATRTAEATARARRALTKLRSAGQPVTFTSVAESAGVSTSFLYQNADLRQAICDYRRTSSPARTASANSATVQSLRTKLEVALRRNRDLVEEVAALRAENETLRSSLIGR